MHKKIAVSFSPGTSKELKDKITENINNALEEIRQEVTGWNGFVDYIEAEPGYFVLIAKCDNEEIREKMQQLINAAVFNPGKENTSADASSN